MNDKVDLHAHSTASDGVLTSAELVELALQRGLRLLAITDHDSTDGVPGALVRAADTALDVWPGIEISTDVPQTEVHMLGYFVDRSRLDFEETLTKLRDSRILRAQQMVAKLNALGMSLTYERVRQLAGSGAVGRPHVAQAMVEMGYVQTSRDAFNLYLSRNGPAYVERFKLTPVEAMELIRSAGGMPVLAHPTYINPGENSGFDLVTFVRELSDAGLVGIECYYGDYPPETVERLCEIARQFDLIPTGGSDFHGRGLYAADLGDLQIPQESLERMRVWRTRNA